MIESKHTLGYCNQCQCEMVFCATCGNNCCNGSSGPDPGNDMSCPDCDEAYAHQSAHWKDSTSVKFASKREAPLPSVDEVLNIER